jgi:hypothetical protein
MFIGMPTYVLNTIAKCQLLLLVKYYELKWSAKVFLKTSLFLKNTIFGCRLKDLSAN